MMPKFKNKQIILLIILSFLVLIGLQLNNSIGLYKQSENKFETHVYNVLTKISIIHEKISDFSRYQAILQNDISGQYQNALKQEFQNLLPIEESVSIRDTFITSNGNKNKYLLIEGTSYDSISDVRTYHQVISRDITELSQLINVSHENNKDEDSSRLGFQLDRLATNSLVKKSEYINELLVSAFRNIGGLSPEQRVDLAVLDSIITFTLLQENISSKFKYLITSQNHQEIVFPAYSNGYQKDLDTTKAYHIRLFPGNLVDDELTLHIVLTNKERLLLSEIWLTLLVSILLIIFVIIVFGVLYRTLSYQSKLDEMKSDFIGNMTHELKTPISTINLACEALADQNMSSSKEDINTLVKMIKDENQRLTGLVEQILQNAALENNNFKLDKKLVNLNTQIKEVSELFRLKLENLKGQIKFNLSNENLEIYADSNQLSNLISNLIDNAIKYSKQEPNIQISTEVNEKHILLTIADQGIGIKKEYLDKIFDKLYRIPKGNIHDVKGFGLGLSYVKYIVEIHGWQIKVTSSFGEGTRFMIYIKKED